MSRPVERRRGDCRCHGSVLLLVLVTIMIMTLATSTYLLLMQNEHVAARHSLRRQQARLLTESGIEYLKVFLGQSQANIDLEGGLLDNTGDMQGQLVVDDALAASRGRFTLLAPDLLDDYYSGVRYGLENESAKLNLITLIDVDDQEQTRAREMLMMLPGMSEETADAILDWLDDDNQTRDFGAEQTFYESLNPPYEPGNGPIKALDELLMVRGVTAELLYGLDANRNYVVDWYEQPRGALVQLDNSLGELNRGWSAYLTVHSLEGAETATGEKKLDLNSPSLQQLHSDLSAAIGETAANFIIAYRQFGGGGPQQTPRSPIPGGGAVGGAVVDAGSIDLDFDRQPKTEINSHLDLVGATLSVQADENGPAQTVESPWQDSPTTYRGEFLQLLDQTTVFGEGRVAGRINLREASRPVLLTIPGLTEPIVDQILSRREREIDRALSEQRHAIWILAEGIVTLEQMKQIDPLVTTGGDVYSGQIVGYFDAGSSRARVQVVIDRSSSSPRLVGWEDLSKLGPGFDLEVLGTEATEEEQADAAAL